MKTQMMKKMFVSVVSLFALVGCGGNSETAKPAGSETKPASTFDTNKTIKVYTRDGTSGTRDGFMTKIGLEDAKSKNDSLVKTITEVATNGNMVDAIKGDEYALGYISLASLEESGLNGLKYDGVEPTTANVLNKSYELTRNFNYIYRNDYGTDSKEKQIVEAFIAYTSTAEGKSIIQQKDGILDVNNTDKSWNDIKSNYPITTLDNSDITITFGGSTSVEKIAKALTDAFKPLCGNFIAQHNHTGSGDAYKHTQGAQKDDAGKLDIGFLSREINLTSTEPAIEGTYGKICTDAIVAVVNSKNPYAETTAEVLKSIYTGEKTLWNQVIA